MAKSESEEEKRSTTAPAPAALDAEAVARLITERRIGGRGFVAWAWTATAAVSISLTAWLLLFGYVTWPTSLEPGAAASLLAWDLIAWLTARTLNRQARELAQARAALAAPELDRRALGGLIEALEWPNRRVQSVARLRLASLLPTLDESAASHVTPEQRSRLYDALDLRTALTEPEYVSAILGALPAIGDQDALARVERLAKLRGFTRGLRSVRDAARACLPRLERRVETLRLRIPAPDSVTGLSAVSGSADRVRADREAEIASHAPVPAHVEDTLKRIETELRAAPMMRPPFLIALWAVAIPYLGYWAVLFSRTGRELYAVLPAALILASTRLHRLTLTAWHRRVARALAELDDVNAVGRLCETLAWPDHAVQAGAVSALTKLLPRLRASDTGLLNATHRSYLYSTLRPEMARTRPEFLVALLKALEQVGDEAAIGPVTQLANGEFRSARQNRVREAACECLPFLQIVARRNQESQTLLRPSAAPEPDSGLLLRPAVGALPTSPELLLRASHQDAAPQ